MNDGCDQMRLIKVGKFKINVSDNETHIAKVSELPFQSMLMVSLSFMGTFIILITLSFYGTKLQDLILQVTKDSDNIKWDAFSRWSFCPNFARGSIEKTTIGRMHPTLWPIQSLRGRSGC